MKTDSLVSIIIPVYNQEKNLDMSIPSAIEQSYSRIEIIAIDDGSTDNSNKILHGYARKDRRIRIFEKKNGGLVSAVSAGIRIAEGEYICFLDPDDRIGPDFVHNFMVNIDDADFIAMGMYSVEPNGKQIVTELEDERTYEDVSVYQNRILADPELNGASNRFFFSRVNKLYKSAVLKQIVDRYSSIEGISFGEDTIFTYLMLGVSRKGVTVKKPNQYYYLVGSDTSMMKNTDVALYYRRAIRTYKCFSRILEEDGHKCRQAEVLFFYHLIGLVQRLTDQECDKKGFMELYKRIRHNKVFYKGMLQVKDSSKYYRIFMHLLRNSRNGNSLYYKCRFIEVLKSIKHFLLSKKRLG